MSSSIGGDEGDSSLRQPLPKFEIKGPIEMPAVAVKETQCVYRRIVGHLSRLEVSSAERDPVGSSDFH